MTYKGPSESGRKAVRKYLKETVAEIKVRVPRNEKALIQEHAKSMNESTNQFVIRAIHEAIQRDRATE